MIHYSPNKEGVFFILRRRGSVFPRALLWAVPNAALAFLLHTLTEGTAPGFDVRGFHLIWASFTSALGFLIIFRNNQSFQKYWEGATLLKLMRGNYLNAVQSLMAFCSSAEGKKEEVEAFQKALVRLMSLLHSFSLQEICDLADDHFDVLEQEKMDAKCLEFARGSAGVRAETVMGWVLRLVMKAEQEKVITAAPPLLTRALMELGAGATHFSNVRKVAEYPFPFAYAQILTSSMLLHWLTTPVFASQVVPSRLVATVLSFFVTLAFWSLVLIPWEMDQPFGADDNDLPLQEMQRQWNRSLLQQLQPMAQAVPTFAESKPEELREIASLEVETEPTPRMGCCSEPTAVAREEKEEEPLQWRLQLKRGKQVRAPPAKRVIGKEEGLQDVEAGMHRDEALPGCLKEPLHGSSGALPAQKDHQNGAVVLGKVPERSQRSDLQPRSLGS